MGVDLVPVSSQSKHNIMNFGLLFQIRLSYTIHHDSASSKESLGRQDVSSLPVMYIQPLSSYVHNPSSTHFKNLKRKVEDHLKFENSEFCLHYVHTIVKIKEDYVTKHS